MTKNTSWSKNIETVDTRIKNCIAEISAVFDGIENLESDLNILSPNEELSEDFYKFLKRLCLSLKESPGIAQFILPHLDELRRQNFLSLLQVSFIPSLDSTASETEAIKWENQINFLWCSLCNHLDKLSLSFLFDSYTTNTLLNNYLNISLLKDYITTLHKIFVPELVWEKYVSYRKKFLLTYNCSCSTKSACFRCFVKVCGNCVQEDVFLLYIGCFHPLIITKSNILETYINIIDEKFQELMQFLIRCLSCNDIIDKEITSFIFPSLASHDKFSKTCLTCFLQNIVSNEIEGNISALNGSISRTIFTQAIIKSIEIISCFEDRLKSIFGREKNQHKIFHYHYEEFSNLYKGKFSLPDESPEQSPFNKSSSIKSPRILQTSDENKISFIWNWRMTMVESGFLSLLQKSLQNEVETVLKTSIDRETELLKSKDWKKLLSSDIPPFASTSVQMTTLLHSVLDTIVILDKYLDVLLTTCDSFLSFKSSFSHSLETYVIDLISHLKQIAYHSKNVEIYYEYIAINNGVFLKNRLLNYCGVLKGPASESPQNNICISASQLVDDLLESVYLHHYKYISCGIMFDADSFNFQDQKPFFEGERVSYSIQMWNLYMKGMYQDFVYLLPQDVALELYGKILASSLEHFLMRYSHCNPSEARTPQIRMDITALVLCASELLWPACSYVSHFIGSKLDMEENVIVSSINKIHSSCCFLLAILSVLTSPIISLHKIFKSGFPHAQLSVRTKYESVSPWLPWVRKELFTDFDQHQSSLSTSVWFSVRVATSWTFPNPLAVVKAYIEQNCTLSVLLLMEASLHDGKEKNMTELFCQNKSRNIELAFSLLELMKCFDKSFFIQNAFLPVIERENGWKEFDLSSEKLPMPERSWWYIAFLKSLKPYFDNIIEDMSHFLIVINKKTADSETLKSWKDIKESFKNFVICLCDKNPLNFLQDDFEISNEVIAFLCVEKVLKSMYSNLVFIPMSLKCFLFSLDSNVKNYVPEIQPFKNSVPLQVLVSGTIRSLTDSILNNKLTDSSKTLLSLTVKSLSSLLFDSADNIIIKNNNLKVLNGLFLNIAESFYNLKKHSENNHKNIQVKEVLNETLDLMVHKVLQLLNGNEIILYLHKMLKHNLNWIQKSLAIPAMSSCYTVLNSNTPSPFFCQDSLGDDQKSLSLFQEQKDVTVDNNSVEDKSVLESKKESLDSGCNSEIYRRGSLKIIENNFERNCHEETLNIDFDDNISPPSYHFNPLEVFDMVGDSSFTQIAAEETEISWDAILSHLPVFGLTEVNFSTLLSHRWDIRKEGPLNDEELKCVEELKDIYKLSTN
ncbi:uncharacterized protein KIAA0825 isoform X1 [Parasteatoda tepidariorum]|uniref:uncharacterized protein KIAA0825 isoform X1 n=1 Tax=Parasteatoda tepidariorum TaxID=114398 RepID=UPI00077F9ABD|nr:uncharacterized protein LOC107441693 isoform X1 [Parasteatoda tepidariorum]